MSLQSWFAERLPLAELGRFARKQLAEPQPRHVSWLHTLGFALLLLFALQIATGVLLLFYYKSGALTAYSSVKFIIEKVTLGGFFRQLHVWGAHFIIVVVFLHILRVFFYGAYKKPRELTWMVGIGLFLTASLFALTGYLLPWDQVAYWGTVVATDATKEIPILGDFLLKLIRGGDTVTDLTLTRFFAIHVFLLPMAFVALVTVHLILARYYRISPLTRTDEPEPGHDELHANGSAPYYPHHFMKELTVAVAAIGLLVILAVFSKPHLGPAANPLVTPAGIKPEWYFLPVYQSLKYVPGWLGVIGNGAFVLFLVMLPLIDRSPERHPARRKVAVWVGIFIVAAGIGLGILGHLSETTREIFGKRIHFDIKGIPTILKESGTSE